MADIFDLLEELEEAPWNLNREGVGSCVSVR